MFARRLNCSNNAFIGKSYHVYFDVFTKFDSNYILFREGGC